MLSEEKGQSQSIQQASGLINSELVDSEKQHSNNIAIRKTTAFNSPFASNTRYLSRKEASVNKRQQYDGQENFVFDSPRRRELTYH